MRAPARIELEVGAREVAALERLEREQGESRELALESGVERARRMREPAGRGRGVALDRVQADPGGRLEGALEHRQCVRRRVAYHRHRVFRAGQEALDECGLIVVALDARDRARERREIVGARVRADALRRALPARLHEQRKAPIDAREIGRHHDARIRHRYTRRGSDPVRPRFVERSGQTQAVGAEARHAGHLEQRRRPGLAIAAAIALGDRERDVERRQLALAQRREQRVWIAEPHRDVSEPAHRGLEQLDGRLGLVLGIEVHGRGRARRVRAEQIEYESEAKRVHGGRIPLRSRGPSLGFASLRAPSLWPSLGFASLRATCAS